MIILPVVFTILFWLFTKFTIRIIPPLVYLKGRRTEISHEDENHMFKARFHWCWPNTYCRSPHIPIHQQKLLWILKEIFYALHPFWIYGGLKIQGKHWDKFIDKRRHKYVWSGAYRIWNNIKDQTNSKYNPFYL